VFGEYLEPEPGQTHGDRFGAPNRKPVSTARNEIHVCLCVVAAMTSPPDSDGEHELASTRDIAVSFSLARQVECDPAVVSHAAVVEDFDHTRGRGRRDSTNRVPAAHGRVDGWPLMNQMWPSEPAASDRMASFVEGPTAKTRPCGVTLVIWSHQVVHAAVRGDLANATAFPVNHIRSSGPCAMPRAWKSTGNWVTSPAELTRPMCGPSSQALSVNQTPPSEPCASSRGKQPLSGPGKTVTWPSVVIRPISLDSAAADHRFPSGLAVIPDGRRLLGTANVETAPEGVSLPMPVFSVNHRLPSGPDTIACGEKLGSAFPNSLNSPAVVTRPMAGCPEYSLDSWANQRSPSGPGVIANGWPSWGTAKLSISKGAEGAAKATSAPADQRRSDAIRTCPTSSCQRPLYNADGNRATRSPPNLIAAASILYAILTVTQL
jgi:hypothetical protein